MRTQRRRSTAAQMVIGIAVIAMGFLFLLDNLGWIDVNYDIQFWPVILIVAGLLKVTQSNHGRGSIVGGIMLLAGTVLMLKGMGVIYVSWRVLAPCLIIAAGLFVVFRGVTGPRSKALLGPDGSVVDSEPLLNAVAILGGFKRRLTTQDFRGGEITAVMGGCELDLRDASINGDAVLNVFAMWGGITIKVPADWTVELDGIPILGGFEEKTTPAKNTGKRLIVRGYTIMGGLEVRN
jgi:predicted membrane protein